MEAKDSNDANMDETQQDEEVQEETKNETIGGDTKDCNNSSNNDASMDEAPQEEVQEETTKMTKESTGGDTTEASVEQESSLDADAPPPTKRMRRAPARFACESFWGKERGQDDTQQPPLEPFIGMEINKRFDDGQFYRGKIISGPEESVVKHQPDGTEESVITWLVRYEDSDEEDMERDEILRWSVRAATTTAQGQDSKPKADGRYVDETTTTRTGGKFATYQAAKEVLVHFPGVTEDEVTLALDQIQGPPYGLQTVMKKIQQNRDIDPLVEPEGQNEQDSVGNAANGGRFRPFVGMRIRKIFNGYQYYGKITSDSELVLQPSDIEGEPPQEIPMWEVTFDDGEKDDMDWYELLRCRADRRVRLHPVRGRQLACLELFSGCGLVTQEFAERKWKVRSVDIAPDSNATDKMSIMDVHSFQPFGFVPDFIWASPPCFTYSNMAGGRHRHVESEQLEKTADALEHNHYFVRMARIMEQAKEKNPHVIFVIENPVGLLSKMPLMKELVDQFGLYRATVHYCAFGREDKKPTHLWTNDFGLCSVLSEFTCERKCPHKGVGVHSISARRHGHLINVAAIPQALAEEVAEYVNAKFYMDRIRYTKEASVDDDNEGDNDNDNGDGAKTAPATVITP